MPTIIIIILFLLFGLVCVLDFIYVRWMRILHINIDMLVKRVKHLEGKITNMDDKIDDLKRNKS